MHNKQQSFKVTDDLYASHGQRFLNFIIDIFVQVAIMLVIINILSQIIGAEAALKKIKDLETHQMRLYTISAGCTLIYYNFCEIFYSRTVGKFFTQTVVVDENGEAPKHETILIRTLCRLIPFFPFSFLGIQPRGWHDRISKTYVVNKKQLAEKKQLFGSLENAKSE